MTIEPAREVRRVTADERAWFVAGVPCLSPHALRPHSRSCVSGHCVGQTRHLQDCVALQQTMNMLPIQADTMALRVPWAATFAAVGPDTGHLAPGSLSCCCTRWVAASKSPVRLSPSRC